MLATGVGSTISSSGSSNTNTNTNTNTNNKPLAGFEIAVSPSVSEKEFAKIERYALSLGAKVSTVIRKTTTTCLLTKRVGDSHYQEATSWKIPIVKTRWIEDCATKKLIVRWDDFLIPAFYGLTISCTGFPPEERQTLIKSVGELGGNFSDKLVRHEVSHLVAKSCEGDKYNHAKGWRTVMIVNKQWIEDCAREKKWIPEDSYLMRAAVPETSKGSALSSLTVSTEDNGSSNSLFSNVPDTGNLLQDVDMFLTKNVPIENYPDFEMLLEEAQGAFHGELFYIVGFSADIEQYLLRCILFGGGHVSYILHPGVTKVALGEQAKESIRITLQRHPCRVEYVNVLWFLHKLFGNETITKMLQCTIVDTPATGR